jgi:hypothetical protein
MDDFFQTIHEAKSWPLKILVFFFILLVWKFYVLVQNLILFIFQFLSLKEQRKSSKKKEKKSDWLKRFFEQKRQIWCQYIALNEKNIFKVFLSFYITEEIRSRLSFLFKFVFLNWFRGVLSWEIDLLRF